jgi:histidyl-tRNA synthetase
MILEHEIPSNSKLYFAKAAKLKREIENSCANILEKLGFSEIITPIFSYHQQESFEDTKVLIRLNDEKNSEVSLRADSTVDVVRIVKNRLDRSYKNNKWFYIQPVFSYPTNEQYQIGAEILEGNLEEATNIALELLEPLELDFTFQIANMAIAKKLVENYGFDLEDIKNIRLDKILSSNHSWINKLVKIETLEDLKDLSLFPKDIANELEKMKSLANSLISKENIIVSPLFYAQMRYYDELVFRAFKGNKLFVLGGKYTIKDVNGVGFALYTDNIIANKI